MNTKDMKIGNEEIYNALLTIKTHCERMNGRCKECPIYRREIQSSFSACMCTLRYEMDGRGYAVLPKQWDLQPPSVYECFRR